MNMTISDVTLKYLCQKYRIDIGTGTNKFLPGIKVRYISENKRFGYDYFGNFFFFGDDFYVWEQDDKYAEDHNQDIVEDFARANALEMSENSHRKQQHTGAERNVLPHGEAVQNVIGKQQVIQSRRKDDPFIRTNLVESGNRVGKRGGGQKDRENAV